ncbi:hypothetical protein IAT38_003008 [Cryptococcus sp. DSM 104549]
MTNAALEDESDPTYTHFAHRAEFLASLGQFLAIDACREPSSKEDEEEDALVESLGAILDFYLPLPGLLDPSLDAVVPPLMEVLGKYLHVLVAEEEGSNTSGVNAKRLERVGRVLNWVVKVRGWKAVVPHFPSTIPNLAMLVTLLSPPTSPSSSTTPSTAHHPLISAQSAWELRAVLLLWLALLLTIPFDLSALSSSSSPISTTAYGIDLPSASLLFSAPSTELAQRVTLLSIPLLNRPGKEGAYAALVLARLFSREDAVHALPGFFDWASAEIRDGDREGEANLVASLLGFLALMPGLVKPRHLTTLEEFLDGMLLPHLRGSRTAAGSGLIRKSAVKAKGRLWLCKIPKDGEELPDGLEEELDDLMGGLSDKDTIVRYSCAKYLARISALLPPDFSSQIVLATAGLFSGTDDEPVVTTSFGTVIDPGGSATTGGTMGFGGLETTRGEARWHGVCLALAEMARRGFVEGEAVEQAVEWAVKALTFDLRRASHSIGANVRDAAAYLLWSLSRACPAQAIAPFAENMATSMVCVALFDREVGVRRAASAAFQEGVGRLGLYPEGIDVLAKTDFYSVSVRRMAFTIAAPAVGVHKVYRDRMREHLHHITLRHWDTAMRSQAGAALRSLLDLGEEADVDDSMGREIQELPSLDAANVHGALVALTHIASRFEDSDPRNEKIFAALSTIRPAALVSSQAADVLTSLCELITNTLNPAIVSSPASAGVLSRYIDAATKRRESEVHESVARVYERLSVLQDCEKDVLKLIADLKSFRVSQRQAATLALGHIQYPACPSRITDKAVKALLSLLDEPAKTDVESRRWAVRSLADVAVQRRDGVLVEGVVSDEMLVDIVQALVKGLGDYTTDQRGDVGSWVRIAALKALGRVLASHPPTQSPNTDSKPTIMIPDDLLHRVIGGVIKQSVEKLEAVRAEGAMTLAVFRQAGWQWDGQDALGAEIKQLGDEGFRYIDQKEWYASGMSLLETLYGGDFLAGLVYSVGSQVVTLSDAALQPLLEYLRSHPDTAHPVIQDLLQLLLDNYSSNRVFIPTLQTVHRLLAGGGLALLQGEGDASNGVGLCNKILAIATKGLAGIKSIERISVTMRVTVVCLTASKPIRAKAVGYLPLFLAHRFPRIRAMSSEEIYLTLSGLEDEVDEELEEVLLETEWVGTGAEEAAGKVVELLGA